jgi:hypothetical protein
MNVRIPNTKLISDPLWGLIDITDFLPMVDADAFQRLGFKYQLGVTNILFPSATHTRKQHSLGAFSRAQKLGAQWVKIGLISKEEAKLMSAYALWHDIGHGPFSHVVEAVSHDLYGRDHDQNGALLIEEHKQAVEQCGINFEDFKKVFTHENPLGNAVHDKNLGAEKLDYLARDAYYTMGEIIPVEYLAEHTYFINGELVIDGKAVDQARNIQEIYARMYKTVYLRKSAAIAQRMMEKMTGILLEANPMSEQAFWSLTDFGLLGLLETSQNETVKLLYTRFITRNLPRTAIAIKPDQFESIESANKEQKTFGVPLAVMEKIVASPKIQETKNLKKLEEYIESFTGLPQNSVLVVPPASAFRFVPKDISIWNGDDAKFGKLSNYFGDHFKALEEVG